MNDSWFIIASALKITLNAKFKIVIIIVYVVYYENEANMILEIFDILMLHTSNFHISKYLFYQSKC